MITCHTQKMVARVKTNITTHTHTHRHTQTQREIERQVSKLGVREDVWDCCAVTWHCWRYVDQCRLWNFCWHSLTLVPPTSAVTVDCQQCSSCEDDQPHSAAATPDNITVRSTFYTTLFFFEWIAQKPADFGRQHYLKQRVVCVQAVIIRLLITDQWPLIFTLDWLDWLGDCPDKLHTKPVVWRCFSQPICWLVVRNLTNCNVSIHSLSAAHIRTYAEVGLCSAQSKNICQECGFYQSNHVQQSSVSSTSRHWQIHFQ